MLSPHAEKMMSQPAYVVLTVWSRFLPANIPIHHPPGKLLSQPTPLNPAPYTMRHGWRKDNQ